MNPHRLALLSLVAVAACSDNVTTVPPDSTPPSFAISDGAHRTSANDPNGNVDFFFLPPMVSDPSGNPNFQAADFNPNLIPLVKVCFLPGATEGAISASTVPDCVHYQATFGAPVNVTNQFYQGAWTVPNSSDIFYRVSVMIGNVTLGFADVESVPNPQKLKTVDKTRFVGQQDGSSLPVKFRIEIGALCDPPGTRPCNSSTINFASGGSLNFSTDGGTTSSGITVPSQGGGNPHTLTLQKCPSFNDPAHPETAIIDLPVFGSCVRVKSADEVHTFTTPAIVQVCDLAGSISAAGLASEAQEHRVTLHKRDGNAVQALPHVAGCAVFTGQTTPSIGSVLADLAHGRFKSAGGKLLSILGPTPLNARRIDEGGGGQTGDISDFQFALPTKAAIDAGDGQSGPVGSALPVQPRVKLTDLGGEPVKGATIKFQGDGVAATSLTSDATGLLSVPWTIPYFGTNTLTANGRGIGGSDNSGPRCGVDPFQPIQGSPHPAEFGPAAVCSPSETNGPAETPITLATGSVTFTATGNSDSFEAPSGWTATGFWHRSTLLKTGSPIVNKAFTDGLVSAASGEGASAGKLPSPFDGSYVFWYGTETPTVGTEDGNYIGTRANSDVGSGGTSTASNSGDLTSPLIVVPANGVLHFQGWFEIESVNPSTFDLMTVSVIDGVTTTQVGSLNPFNDPLGGSPPVPLTSGGFDAPPVWADFSADLSAYAGHSVRLKFSFNTGDQLYNGFRGWLVDKVSLAAPIVTLRAALLSAGRTLNPPRLVRTRRP